MVFFVHLLASNKNGPNLLRGETADTLEHCVKGMLPILRLSESKFLFGTSVKNV